MLPTLADMEHWRLMGDGWFPSRILSAAAACRLTPLMWRPQEKEYSWLWPRWGAEMPSRWKGHKELGSLLSILAIHFLVEASRRQYVFVPSLEEMRSWLLYPSFQAPFHYHMELRPYFWLLKRGLLYLKLTLNLLVTKDDLETPILLPSSLPCWDYKCVPAALWKTKQNKNNFWAPVFDCKTLWADITLSTWKKDPKQQK